MNAKQLYTQEICSGTYSILKQQKLSEKILYSIYEVIDDNHISSIDSIITSFITSVFKKENYSIELDWNLGSIIQHFEGTLIIKCFKNSGVNPINSIGLTWVFGEFKVKDPLIVSFLYEVVDKSTVSDAWWRAAYSLQSLGFENAVVFLKRHLKQEGLKSLDNYLKNLHDKKSVIGILLQSNSENLKSHIYPFLKERFLTENKTDVLINTIWLIGRLKLIDKDIYNKIKQIITDYNPDKYELVYYTVFALQQSSNLSFKDTYKLLIQSDDALLRKMAIRGLSVIEMPDAGSYLLQILEKESNPQVIGEITRGVYKNLNAKKKEQIRFKNKYTNIENGTIFDFSDKWYSNPDIYEVFSQAEDPENICLNIILNKIKSSLSRAVNPIDLATGTGRMIRFLLENLDYDGVFYAIDSSQPMLEYLKSVLNRNRGYLHDVKLINSDITNLKIDAKSNLIISSFGFPSKIYDLDNCIKELESIYRLLTADGILITLGWDETFNDQLNSYWYLHIPDSISAGDFETWRKKRQSMIKTPRNSYLNWYKKGLSVPLLFNNVKESARIMGHLFGKDAAEDIIENNLVEWEMSLGITFNTKLEIEDILKGLKKVK